MSKLYIGIDPGRTGAWAFIDTKLDHVEVIDMCLLPDKSLNSLKMYKILSEYLKRYDRKEVICILEKAQSLPKQGIVSTFNYASGYGELKAILKIAEIPFEEVRPAVWKKYYNLSKKQKQGSVDLASTLYPDIEFYGKRGGLKHDRAEALLLADYGMNLQE